MEEVKKEITNLQRSFKLRALGIIFASLAATSPLVAEARSVEGDEMTPLDYIKQRTGEPKETTIKTETSKKAEIIDNSFEELFNLTIKIAVKNNLGDIAHNPNHPDNLKKFDGQCVSTVNFLNELTTGETFNSMPLFNGGAGGPEQAWNNKRQITFPEKNWEKIKIDKNTTIKPGDNLVSLAGTYGHIVFVSEIKGGEIKIVESNWDGTKNIREKTLQKADVSKNYIGLFRPRISEKRKQYILSIEDDINYFADKIGIKTEEYSQKNTEESENK